MTLHLARKFTGLDLFHPPSDLPPGALTQADNVYIDSGEIVTRPGKAGLFTTPLSAGIWGLTAYVRTDGVTELVFVSGGKLYKYTKGGGAAPVEILNGGASFTFNSPAVRMERLGQSLFIIDGTLGLVRLFISTSSVATAAFVSGMTTPKAAPGASLTDTVFDAVTAAQWTADTLSSGLANRLLNPVLGPGSSTYTSWTKFGTDPDDSLTDGNKPYALPAGQDWLLADNPYEGLATTAALTNDTVTQDAARNAALFLVGVDYVQKDPSGVAGFVVEVIGYDGGNNELGRRSVEFHPAYGANALSVTTFRAFVSFADIAAPVTTYKYRVYGASSNIAGPSSIFLTNLYCSPAIAAPGIGAAQAGGLALVPQTAATGGGASSQTIFNNFSGLHLTHDFGSNQAGLASTNTVSLGLNGIGTAASGAVLPKLRLAFRTSGSSVRNYTNVMSITPDGLYATVDISTIPNKGSFRYLEVVIVQSVGLPVWGFGPVIAPGNLSIGYADYYYETTEVVNAAGSTYDGTQSTGGLVNEVESNPSPASAVLTPTPQNAEVLITQPTIQTAAATHWRIYRFGGVFGDGVGRLIATLPIATTTYTDNITDGTLFFAVTLFTGRDNPVAGAQAIAAWQGRLWLAKGTTLYASWNVSTGAENALYFTLLNLTTDPNQSIKGATFSLGAADNDTIAALVPYGTSLHVLKTRSVWLVFGYDPTQFSAQSYLLKAGVGLLAPLACGVMGNKVWLLGPDGLYQFDGDVVDPVSVPVERVLNQHGWDGSTTISAAAYALCAAVYYDRRFFLFAPVPGGSSNSVAFVYDSRTDGYVRWTNMAITCAASLTGGSDQNELYLGGSDGQLYHLFGAADAATAGGASAPIAWAVQTRGMGQEDNSENYWRRDIACRYFALLKAANAQSVIVSATGDDPAQAWSQAYALPASIASGAGGALDNTLSGTNLRLKVPSRVRGHVLAAGVSGSSTSPVRITSLGMEIALGREGT